MRSALTKAQLNHVTTHALTHSNQKQKQSNTWKKPLAHTKKQSNHVTQTHESDTHTNASTTSHACLHSRPFRGGHKGPRRTATPRNAARILPVHPFHFFAPQHNHAPNHEHRPQQQNHAQNHESKSKHETTTQSCTES